MKKIAYTRPDGGVSIVTPAKKSDLEKVLGPLTEEEYSAHVYERSIPEDATHVQEIDEDYFPSDRYFRNAWRHDGKDGFSIDMTHARKIHIDKIREKRDEALKVLDIETLKGKDVQKEKQALRDIPQTFDLIKAKTPEELKQLWPNELK